MDQLDGNSSHNPNILIVDTKQDSQASLKAFFQTKGYSARAVKSGDEAVAYMQTGEPDAVVMEATVPEEKDCWDAFSKIRLHSDIPVLFVTPQTAEESRPPVPEQAESKPPQSFSREELLAQIDALLNTAVPRCSRQYKAEEHNKLRAGLAITVIIPAYNESRFIGSTVLKARAYADTVIVVDDGSSDNTAELAEAAGALVVRHPCNMGKSAALNSGFAKARELNAQAVVTLDADGQHLPEELAQVVAPVLAGEADIVIGSRYLVPKSAVPLHRRMGHWFFNRLTGIASGVSATDSQSGYRAFSRAALEVLSFCSQGFTVESEIQFIAHEQGLRLKEVPVTILYQDKPKRSVISQGTRVLGGVLKLAGQYHPLLYFGLAGTILITTGILWGWHVAVRYEQVHQLAVGNALICIMLNIVGITVFSTGVILHSIRGLLIDTLHKKQLGR